MTEFILALTLMLDGGKIFKQEITGLTERACNEAKAQAEAKPVTVLALCLRKEKP